MLAIVSRDHCVVALAFTFSFPAFLRVLLLITGAGADFVMIGGMFAGHDQSAGEIIERNGKKVKLFYGMSSDTAMKKHAGGVAEYRYEFHTGAIAVSPPSRNFWSRIGQKETGLCCYSHWSSCCLHLQQLRGGWHQRETGRRSWGWLAESSDVHLFAADMVCCHCCTSCVVWEVIRHSSDLLLLQDVYELNAGTWHSRLQFLSLCLSTLGVFLV